MIFCAQVVISIADKLNNILMLYTKPDIYSEASWSQDSHNIETYAVKVLAYETLHMKHSLTYKGKQTKHFKKYVNELIMRVESHNWICQIPDSLQLAYNHINTLNFGQAHCPAQKYPECYCWYNCCACPQLPVCWMPQPYCSTQSKKEFSPCHNMERSSVDVHSQNRESNTGKSDPARTFSYIPVEKNSFQKQITRIYFILNYPPQSPFVYTLIHCTLWC